jgi:hypothetical protein
MEDVLAHHAQRSGASAIRGAPSHSHIKISYEAKTAKPQTIDAQLRTDVQSRLNFFGKLSGVSSVV